jgi:hypothetical protein
VPLRAARGGATLARLRGHTDPPFEEDTEMTQGPWFFCLKHNTVEGPDGCAERHRLGPFATQEEAAAALQKVAERNEQADAEDRAWDRGE